MVSQVSLYGFELLFDLKHFKFLKQIYVKSFKRNHYR